MQTCSTCGAHFSGYGFTCAACKTQNLIKEEGEKNRRQNEYMAQEAAAQAERESHYRREHEARQIEQAERESYYQRVHEAKQIDIENQKLSELQKQTRLIEEQAISVKEAFEEGRALAKFSCFIFSNDERFYFDNPYLTAKLNKSFASGVSIRVSEIFSGDAWRNDVFLRIKEIAANLRSHFDIFEGQLENQGFFHEAVSFERNGVEVDCGLITVDLSIRVEEHTGRIYFNSDNSKVTENDEINSVFENTFDFNAALEFVNGKHKKLRRLEAILVDKIEKYSELIRVHENNNSSITFNNLRAILGNVTAAYGLYILFTFGWSIFNIIPALGVWGLAALLAGDNWSFQSGEGMSKHKQNLAKLNESLLNVRREIDGNEFAIENGASGLDGQAQIPFQKNNSNFKKFITLSLVMLACLLGFYIYNPKYVPASIKNLMAQNLPNEVNDFVQKKEACDHFLGEPPHDSERKKFIKENVKKYCPNTDTLLSSLKNKYHDNKAVMERLSQYASLGILETSAPFGNWYVALRKRLLASNWKPWGFTPLSNFQKPFPEVMVCDEGYCQAYFSQKNSQNVLHVIYKMCDTNSVGSCPGYENNYLMIEDYETIRIERAKELNRIAISHFEGD